MYFPPTCLQPDCLQTHQSSGPYSGLPRAGALGLNLGETKRRIYLMTGLSPSILLHHSSNLGKLDKQQCHRHKRRRISRGRTSRIPSPISPIVISLPQTNYPSRATPIVLSPLSLLLIKAKETTKLPCWPCPLKSVFESTNYFS